jgi:hypothetical protein
MSDDKPATAPSRRGFLNSGAAFLTGGVICSAVGIPAAAARRTAKPETAELPWSWATIDPMEAGSRAFRFYHDVGG